MYEIRFYRDKNDKEPVKEYIAEMAAKKDKDSRIKLNKIMDYVKPLGNKKAFAQTTTSLALLYQGMWQEHKNPESRETQEMLEKLAFYQQDAIGIFEDIFQGKLHPNLASAYNNMAENCTAFEKKRNVLQLALDCLEKCRKIRVEGLN